MKIAVLTFLLASQPVETLSPATVQCELDTELTLTELSVTVEEKREISETPHRRDAGGGIVTLRNLPEGNLRLLFYRQSSLLGKINLTHVEKGQFIRIKVRLVDGNAILLDEFRIRGVSGVDERSHSSPPSQPKPVSPPRTESSSPTPPATSSVPTNSKRTTTSAPPISGQSTPCPETGELMTLRGTILSIIDNDSFELQSGPWTYTVYIGSATRLHRGRATIQRNQLKENQPVTVKGNVAAGPEGDCSIGAKEVELRR